ncbi:MAG: ABC transporter ATP-binding protein [Actinomycetota bacterium]
MCILITDLLSLLIPWILKLAIDGIKNRPESVDLILFSGMLVAVACMQGIFRFFMRKLLIGISRKIEYSLRTDFFSHLQKIHSSFFTNTRTGSIMALITNDLEAVRNFLGPGVMNLFNTIFVFASTLTVMFLIDIKLSLYSLIAIPILPILVSKLSSLLYSRFKKSQEQYAALSARTQESISGIKVIKSFAQEGHEKKVFADLNQGYVKRNLSLAKIRAVFWPSMIFVGGIGTLVVLFIGGKQVIAGVLTLGQFVQFSSYIGSITWPLISLGWVINLIQRGSVSIKRINKIFDIEPEIKSPVKPKEVNQIKGDIKFENVYFRYGDKSGYDEYIQKNLMDEKLLAGHSSNGWVVENINFEVSQGMQLGIVGFTGSAKSTLLNLIPRLYDPQKGSIYIDGVNIKQIRLEKLRSSIGYVKQEPFLFSRSIKDNILFGSANDFKASEIDKKIEHASRLSHLHEDIVDFPDGYDTVIGERGVTLSGGQKQRLAIARALLVDPSLLILDDSFSNIDTGTEELILRDLKKNTKGKTTIIVSHRISTIKDSDLIIVMDEGKIIEMGDHQQLLDRCSIYQKLYYRQQLSEELEEEL